MTKLPECYLYGILNSVLLGNVKISWLTSSTYLFALKQIIFSN